MNLKGKKLFLFDIDGTLALGDDLFEGSRELLSLIENIGGKAYFITNNSTKSGKDYVDKFNKWNLKTSESDFISAGYVAEMYLKEHFAGKRIYVAGTRSFINGLSGAGLNIVSDRENPECVLVAFDSEFTYEKASAVSKILFENPEIPYLATNPDLRCPVPFGFVPDCGAICKMIECATEREPLYLGKPNRMMVDLCINASGFSPLETLVVGDRLYTDIAAGIAAGVDTCLLYTGEAKPGDVLTTRFVPTYAFDTVSDLLSSIK